jgi:septal ring factor EnvC (AmiA/AmiB activator)
VKELEGINEIDTANLLRNALLSAISVGTPGEVKVSKPEKSNDDVEQITFNSLMEGKLTEAEVLEIIKGAQSNHITALEMGLAKFRDARKKIDEQKKVDEQKKDDEKNIQGNGSDHQKKELALQEELDKTREELNKAKEELNRTRKENEELKIRKENEELNKKDGDNGNPTPSSSSSTPSPTSENKNTSPREIRQ